MKRDQLKEYFRRCYSGTLLTEQDDEEAATDDLFGDEGDPGDADTGDVPEDADTEAADDEGDTETEKEEGVEIEAGDEKRLGKQLDHAIDSILVDFESNALKSAAIETERQEELEVKQEWWNKPISNMLFEQDEESPAEEITTTDAKLDIDKFAGDVANLIKNYDVLLDMEDIIFKKAFSFIEEKYGEEVAKAFEESLIQTHDLDFSSQSVEMEDSIVAPIAVGAGGEGGGGAV